MANNMHSGLLALKQLYCCCDRTLWYAFTNKLVSLGTTLFLSFVLQQQLLLLKYVPSFPVELPEDLGLCQTLVCT